MGERNSWVIEGKRYRIDTADYVADHHPSGVSRNDFNFYEDTLYLSPRGNWFIVGYGGAMSHWATSCGNGHSSGDGCSPLTPVEAREKLEEWGEQGALEQYFGQDLEDA